MSHCVKAAAAKVDITPPVGTPAPGPGGGGATHEIKRVNGWLFASILLL